MTGIPRILWMFWAQGWDEAPAIVRACARTWRRLNPGWDIRLLNRASLPAHLTAHQPVEDLLQRGVPIVSTSNVLRASLLSEHGGVWADATVYCLRPLDEWIDRAAREGFFAFARPGPERMLSSWFLASRPGGLIINRWLEASYDYWDGRAERHIYWWFHELFGKLYEAEEDFRAAWDRVPEITARGPHTFDPPTQRLLAPPRLRHRVMIPTAATPLLKLSFKFDEEAAGMGSAYRWLMNRPEARLDPEEPLPVTSAAMLRYGRPVRDLFDRAMRMFP